MRLLLAAAAIAAFPFTAALADPIEVLPDPAAASGEVVEIEIKDMAFGTPEVKVKKGGVVRWKNADEIGHNVHFRQGPAKGLPKAQGPMLDQNTAYAVKFNEAGEYSYLCTPHPMMKGKVIVE